MHGCLRGPAAAGIAVARRLLRSRSLRDKNFVLGPEGKHVTLEEKARRAVRSRSGILQRARAETHLGLAAGTGLEAAGAAAEAEADTTATPETAYL